MRGSGVAHGSEALVKCIAQQNRHRLERGASSCTARGDVVARRRSVLLALLASGVAFRTAAARAQASPRMWRIGYLGPSPATAPHLLKAFKEGLASFGYVEGRNTNVVYRWTNAGTAMNVDSALVASARELVGQGVDVLLASIDPAILAARQAAGNVPIIMLNVSDPVALGLVASLAHPGGNITGMTRLSPQLVGKNLQILLELLPRAERIGLLMFASSASRAALTEQARQATRDRGLALQIVVVATDEELESAFVALKRERADALLVPDTGSGLFFTDRARLAELAMAHRIPAAYANRENVDSGGLIAYSASSVEHYRRAAAFIDRILRGTKPGDIPIEQPSRFELVVNLKTAKALNLAVPQSLILSADQVIS